MTPQPLPLEETIDQLDQAMRIALAYAREHGDSLTEEERRLYLLLRDRLHQGHLAVEALCMRRGRGSSNPEHVFSNHQ